MASQSFEGLVFRDAAGAQWVPILPGERWKTRKDFRFPDGVIRYCRPKHPADGVSGSPVPVTFDQLQALSKDLIKVGEILEQLGSPEWLTVARAAALVDGLRFNVTEVVPHALY